MSTNHFLVDITDKIQGTCSNSSFVCGVFVDFKKSSDTVNHNTLPHNISCYEIRGTKSNYFKSYQGTRQRYTTVNSLSSKSAYNRYGVPEGSVLEPLLFLIYINDLNKAIKFSTFHHFEDDTNLILSEKSLKKINEK